mgnify:CR=1 FL=1
MQETSIVAGAFSSVVDSRELTYGQYCSRSIGGLPAVGGVGKMPLVIHHQHRLPTCTGEAGASLRAITYYQQTGRVADFSALFIYKMNRLYDGLASNVRGSTLKATMQSLEYKGACRERLYPSTKANCDRPFPNARQGGKLLLADAAQFKMGDYLRCANIDDMLLALADGRPVIFSLVIYTDFYLADRGLVSSEIAGERIGGHSMVAMNYDLQRELLEVVQSWGKSTEGPTDHGYMYIPFSWFRQKKEGRSLLLEAYTPI